MDGRIKLEYLNSAMKTKVRRRRASLRKQKYRDGLQTIKNVSKENRDYRKAKYLAWCRRRPNGVVSQGIQSQLLY